MLSLLVFFPFLFGGLLFLMPKKLLNTGALTGAVLHFLLSCSLFFLFDFSRSDLQLKESFELVPFLGIRYLLALDGLSFWYVLLSSFLLPLVVLFSSHQKNPLYFFLLFSLVTLSNGVFLSFDGILFYIFFELSLFPLFFMIFLWGGKRRIYASFKFLIYTFFASLFLLGGFIIMMLMNKSLTGEISARITDFYLLDFVFIQNNPLSTQALLFFCFAFAFAVKTPLVPFHTWLPLAHVEAPTGASVYLAAVILKMGTYGWFRFVLPLFPEASAYYSPWLLFLAVFSLIYASVLAFAQTDIKKLVAYSSVSHMAYVLIGVFAFNIYGLQGAFYQTLTHGLSSAALFLMVGLIYKRTGTRDIRNYGGLSKSMPYLAISFFIISLSVIALPLTGGFVSEFLVLLGSYLSGKFWIWPAISAVVLTAVYMLNLFQKIFLLEESKATKNLKDLNLQEFLYLSPLAVLVLIMGVFPHFFFKYSKASLDHLSENQSRYSLSFYGEKTSEEKQRQPMRDKEIFDKKTSDKQNQEPSQRAFSDRPLRSENFSSYRKEKTEKLQPDRYKTKNLIPNPSEKTSSLKASLELFEIYKPKKIPSFSKINPSNPIRRGEGGSEKKIIKNHPSKEKRKESPWILF